MFPISSDYPVRGNSPVTWTIIVLCAGIAFLQTLQTPPFSDETFLRYGAHPALVVFDIFPWNPDSLTVASSLVTSLFVHAGFWHVVGNMLFFHCFSMPVESLMGPWRYSIFYLLCGIAAGLTHSLCNPDSFTPLVGASGAVAGVLAAHTILLPWTRIQIPWSLAGPNKLPAWSFTALWLLYQAIYAMDDQSDVAWLAHVGGIAAGLMLAPLFSKPGVLVMAPTPGTDEATEHGQGYKISTLPAAALAVVLVAGIAGLLWGAQSSASPKTKARAGEWVAIARIDGVGAPMDAARGLARYREAAEYDPGIVARLAKLLNEGKVVPRNAAEAMVWYRRAAEAGQPDAMKVYALALIDGDVVPRDRGKGIALLGELAKQGYSSAELQLGLVLEAGRGGAEVDLAGAIQHYQRACESSAPERAKAAGRYDACRRYAQMLKEGRGVPSDPDKAAKLLEKLKLDGMIDAAQQELERQLR